MTEVGDGSISAALRTWTARDPDRPAITEIVFDGARRRERTFQIDHLRRRADVRLDLLIRSDGDDRGAADGQRLRVRLPLIHRHDLSVAKDEIRRRGRGLVR